MNDEMLVKAVQGLEENYQSVFNWTVFERSESKDYMWMGTITNPEPGVFSDEISFELIDLSAVSSVFKKAPAMVNLLLDLAYVPNVNWRLLAG